ncbi:FAD-dependent oxidoreductase [Arcobacter sp. LA11]|uniref:FAD-dependent oxidoreductase n=1 Tax=Arcobacter sp. LA11 TaxID=1898176 RepID=UPI000932CE0F|nr:FAD-dependent oxidoreductase [Arcobacter sp. LA11]
MIDVLIIGSGGAGLTAALNAKKEGAKVLVVSKTYPTHSQTCQAQGGINAVLKETENDSIQKYIEDTYKASHKLGNKEYINYFCSNSENTISWLDSIGVPFSKNIKDNISQRKFGGTKAKRTCYSSDYTGLKILHTLYDQCLKENIEFYNEYQLLNLIIENNKAIGITALDIETSQVKQIKAKTIILATGGYAGLYYGFTTNSYSSTGDGIASALNAGAKISNMEFMQFHPTALENKNILISESARGEGGYLVDNQGNRFIDELKPRDEVARAIYKKYEEGEKVYLDLRHLGLDKINEAMPQERRLVQEFMQLKMEKDLIPINPSAHYSMGGIITDIEAKSSIENLYACGECSQSGIHGANRLGGNSLLEIVTFGKIAGENAAKKAKKVKIIENTDSEQFLIDKNYIEGIFTKDSEIDFYKRKKELGKLLFKNVGLFREEKSMKNSLEKILEWKKELNLIGLNDKSKIFNKNLTDLIEYKNMIELAHTILISALNRQESRGAHFRIDFKDELENYDKNSILFLENDSIHIKLEEIQ